ncbi:hypothetical protein L3X38_002976 [Prunus dulcis]|uniref:Reverse transcriptase Ty1/copia-type domain-containing protein n=1 Tax=Prunus dulcis TaxID=3755 RepID=A0AAD4WV27_PRUDU|nr:hypothetical protein L3X38_002976 [Prunus dulcis]
MRLKDTPRSSEEEYEETMIDNIFSQIQVTIAAPNVDSPSSTPVKPRDITEIYARCNMSIIEPENFAEASKDKAWQKAMEIEMEMIEKNETWELVDRPSDKLVIGVKWVLDTIRTLIALAAQKGWKLYQLDVKFAFLNRAPRAWYEEINAYLISCGYVRSTSEATLYCKTKEDYGTLIVSIYVDDIVYTGSSEELIEDFKTEMMRRYEMTDLGLLYHFLGMAVIQTENCIFINQKKYALILLSKFSLKQWKPVSTPLVASEKLCKDDGSGTCR